jgi:hypothetical protein
MFYFLGFAFVVINLDLRSSGPYSLSWRLTFSMYACVTGKLWTPLGGACHPKLLCAKFLVKNRSMN